MPFARFRTAATCLGLSALLAGTASAAPRDFSDDFNDGFLDLSFLLDRDGNLDTAFDQTPEPLWFVIRSSSEAANASLIEIEERGRGRRGDIRFSSPNNNATFSVTGYTSFSLGASTGSGAFEGWAFDAQDRYDDALHFADATLEPIIADQFGPVISRTQSRVDQIRTVSPRFIGRPADFSFTVEMRFGHRSNIRAADPIAGSTPRQGISIVLSDIEDGPIGYVDSVTPRLNSDYVEVFVENTAAPALTLGVRRYQAGAVIAEASNPYIPGSNFDGRAEVSFDNVSGTLNVTFVDRRGAIAGQFNGFAAFRDPVEIVRAPMVTSFNGENWVGACCFEEENMCVVTDAANCAAAGGEYRFTGSDCNAGNCSFDDLDPEPDPPLGACCFDAMNDCMELTAVQCLMMGGAYVEDGIGCNGACINQYDPGEDLDGDGFEDIVRLEECPRIVVSIVAFSERPANKMNTRNARIDDFEITGLNYQNDGNPVFANPDPDVTGDGVVTAADIAAALTAFPPASDLQIAATYLATPGAPNPEDFIKDRQWNRAVSRYYRDEVLPLFAGQRTQREKRQDRAFLKDLRDFD